MKTRNMWQRMELMETKHEWSKPELMNQAGQSKAPWRIWLEANDVPLFAALTVLLSAGLLLLPLPVLVGPALVVFIPTLLAVPLVRLTQGRGAVRTRFFSRAAWRPSLKWAAVGLGLALALRVGISALGLVLVPGYQVAPGPFSPLFVMALLFAAGEEIGWRGFALPRLLGRRTPLAATLLLGVLWALLHLPLTLPGKLSAGSPPLAQFMSILGLAVVLTWLYLASGGSLLAVTLLHGGQNGLAFLSDGLSAAAFSWLMAGVYVTAALVVILVTRGRLSLPRTEELALER